MVMYPFHFSLSCIGEGNGNPLQCSCLENPRDGGAWAAVCGVTYIDLDNSLFDNDAIILTGVKSATLESPDSERSVTVIFPDAKYVGFWQPDHSDAPFLCIEPWQSLPASDAPAGSPADQISERKGFVTLAPGASYNFSCTFIFN